MNSVETLQQRLQRLLNIHVELIVNENRSTMLSLLERQVNYARLSVHKMFLEAPDPVISALAHYVRGTRKERKQRNLLLREFIQSHLSQSDYTHLVKPEALVQKGSTYDLGPLYREIDEKYFNGQLNLSVTWYGSPPKMRRRSRITFGQYLSGLRLIKIHRMLDDPFFPEFFVSFILYHEMLHSVVPGSADGKGRYTFHGRAFKEREKAFEHYQKAIQWEKNNKDKLFSYGWS